MLFELPELDSDGTKEAWCSLRAANVAVVLPLFFPKIADDDEDSGR